MFSLSLLGGELRFLLAHLPLDLGHALLMFPLKSILYRIDRCGGRLCRSVGLLCFRCRHGLHWCIEQRRLTRLRQFGAVVSAAGLAARLGYPPFFFRKAEQVVQAHDQRLDFGFLLFGKGGRSCGYFDLHGGGFLLYRLVVVGRLYGLLFFFRPCAELHPIFGGRFRRSGRRLLLCPSSDTFERSRNIHIPPHIESFVEILREHPAQICADTLRTALMQIDHCGLAVGIGVLHGFRMNDTCPVEKEAIHDNTRFQQNGAEKLVILFRETLFALVLLQDNKVAADLRSGIVGKEVVRQPDDRYGIGMAKHLTAYFLILR